MDERLHNYTATSGALPSASPVWTDLGTGGVTVASGRLTVTNDDTAARGFRHIETNLSNNRSSDTMSMQASVLPVTFASSGAWDTASPAMLISDGVRQAGLAFGTAMAWIRGDGTVVATALPTMPRNAFQHVRLVKRGSDRFEAWLGRKLVSVLAYNRAGLADSVPAYEWGNLDPEQAATSQWGRVEIGLNLELPAQWRVDSVFRRLLAVSRERWSDTNEAALRATVGIVEDALRNLEGVYRSFTVGETLIERATITGDKLPTAEIPAWSVNGSAGVSLQRNRVRFDGDAASAIRVDHPLDQNPVALRLRATWRVDSNGGTGEAVGPAMSVFTGARRVAAQMVRLGNADASGWRFTTTPSALDRQIGEPVWPVNVDVSHDVEIRVLGDVWAMLLVDGVIVDRLALTEFDSNTTSSRARIEFVDGTTTVADVERVVFESVAADMSRRPGFLLTSMERLIFVGGCERNDELDAWMRHHFDVQGARGTSRGILMELRRLTCSQNAFVQFEDVDTTWYVNQSYPGITPVILGGAGLAGVVVAEIPYGALNFTLTDLAALVARYLLPMSTLELRYSVALATLTTGSATTVSGGYRYPVSDVRGFTTGDTVEVHNAANDVRYQASVQNVETGYITIPVTAGAEMASGSTIRRTLAQS